MILLKNVHTYAPHDLGITDVLIAAGKILHISKNIEVSSLNNYSYEIVECKNKILAPGYIDQHVHMIGGGGEAGPYTRTPEVSFTKAIEAGITTMVGVLGTDGTGRHLESLLAKSRALETEGISTYILTGSYEVPVNTLTGSIRRDIILIDKILGVGEVAISDHRSSQPTLDELKRIATEARLGGMLSGKAGVFVLHMGDGKTNLSLINKIIDETEIPMRHFIPTHVNRNHILFNEAMQFAINGGYIDITSGISNDGGFGKAIKPSEAIKKCIEHGVPIEKITMSSDGNGSMSEYDENGNVKRLLVTQMNSLHEELKDTVLKEKIPFETAIQILTSNVAKALGIFPQKGSISTNMDADLLIFDSDLNVDSVIAKGKFLMKNKQILTKGTFE